MSIGQVVGIKNHYGRYYIGSTNDLERRLKEHFGGKSVYTKNLRPLQLVFSQEFDNLKKVREIERIISAAVVQR